MNTKRNILWALVGLMAGFSTADAAWTTKRLTHTAGRSRYSDVAVSGSNIYVVWQDVVSTDYEILFRTSADGGATWKTAQKLTNNATNSVSPRIAVDGSNVYVVWYDYSSGNDEIYFRTSANGGATWKTAQKLTNNAGHSFVPAIAVNGSNVYVVWEDNTPGNYEIYFQASADGGATWKTAQRLTKTGGNSFYPAIAVSGSNIYVVWQDVVSTDYEILFRTSADGGATWKTAQRLTDNATNSVFPRIAIDGSNVYAVWYDYPSGNDEIYFRKSSNGGATWKTARMLTNNAGHSFVPAIAVDGSNVYLVWEDNTPGNYEIYFQASADGGATWQTAQRLTNTGGDSFYPALAIGASKIYVVWEDSTPGNYEIFLTSSPLKK